ncbi:MAG: sulfite exporter TauE/SafE family protein [Candidatus Aenigmatarchaeota archaeon]|nr:MAG: sulfite exporter TauE/SafE family protein [Candidatus Aenigmarchaeota archaeon]
MDPFVILLLAILNFFLSFYSVIVGGGSLFMVPLLIYLGIPAPNSVAISRFYNIGTGTSGLLEFNREGKVNWRIGMPLAVVAMVASLVGAQMVLGINEILLKRIIAVFILLVLLVIVFNKKIGIKMQHRVTMTRKSLGVVMTFFAVMVATIVGGGSGITMTYIMIFLFGQTLLQSMGTRKIVTLTGVTFSAVFFVISGIIIYEIAVPLLITGALGGWVGSKYAIKKGDKWVRIFFIIMVAILALNMLVNV